MQTFQEILAINDEDAIAGENFLKCLHLLEAMKKSRAKQRGTSNRFEVFRVSLACPSCLAGYFTWPQVALTHHACHRRLYAPRPITVKFARQHFLRETVV